jgi:uncharacterized protein (TIGR03437 family)
MEIILPLTEKLLLRRNEAKRNRHLAIGIWIAGILMNSALPAQAITIVPKFDTTITGQPNAQEIESCINAAASIYQGLFTDNVTVTILFRMAATDLQGTPVTLGRSLRPAYSRAYADYANALAANKSTAHDTTALTTLPASSSSLVRISSALGRALGFNTPGNLDDNGQDHGTYDGIITLGSERPLQFTRGSGVASSRYDALRVIEHEIDEVLGLGSVLDLEGVSGQIKPEDLFRYSLDSGSAARSVDAGAASSFFSIDGGLGQLEAFNQDASGDRGDWLSPSCTARSARQLVQYAFTCPGSPADISALSPEGIALDVIGYHLAYPTTPPAISPGGIVPNFSTTNVIQPGSWASIYGSNLATVDSAIWTGTFPAALGETRVAVNGKPAYLWYVSPTQINFQAPDDTAIGPVPVVVSTPAGVSTAMVNLAPASPSFSLLGDGKHVAAVILRKDGSGAYGSGSYDIAGPPGSSLGYKTVAAKAGDSLELYGVGFGPTAPTVLAGQPFSGAAGTIDPVVIRINNTTVIPGFAGISAAGLYQINITIPPGLGTGDASVIATTAGVSTQAGVVIALQ